MRIPLLTTSLLTLALTAGCGDGAAVQSMESESELTPITTQTSIMAMFSGATFVSLNPADATDTTIKSNRIISFTRDEVTYTQGAQVEIGQYSEQTDSTWLATFPDYEVVFSANGGDLTWDSQNFDRAAASQFDSQDSLVTYLNNSTYNSIVQLDTGTSAVGGLAMGNWSISFSGNEVTWEVQDTVSVGTYTYLDGSSFNANFSGTEVTVVMLENQQFVINTVVYERDDSTLFDSQTSLITFLDGASYKSLEQKDRGEISSGLTALGYWYVDFVSDTVSWTYQDVVSVGTFNYVDINTFSAELEATQYTVEVQGNELILDGVRYSRVDSE